MGPGIEAKARAVRLAIFDVDGIMTDGTLWITDSGEEFKGFNTRDGHGLKMLQESGITLAILSGRRSRCVENRARDLGIAHVLQGISRKQEGFDLLLRAVGVEASQTAYMGDDLVDLPVLRRCGLSATVPEAPYVPCALIALARDVPCAPAMSVRLFAAPMPVFIRPNSGFN
jgi:3-deoxy-D-manno-octulosonate 8-phosphate phosphatase (KDO 8-P phosphatase)